MSIWGQTHRHPMADLTQWLQRQARHEANAVRLEDLLLGGRFVSYFIFRLRYFALRTAFAAALHAVKIVLLLSAFPHDQFAVIIALAAGAAIANDFWWGALERMRGRIRALRHDGAVHRVPAEIGSWLRFARYLSLAGVTLTGAWVTYRLALDGRLGPIDAYAATLATGAAMGLTIRTYHSGAYAFRRIFRPLPSILVADTVGIVSLLGLWPLWGLWALPVSEMLATACVLAITIHYTSRTYRVLGFPSFRSLLRTPRPLPASKFLLFALAPGAGYAAMGIESLLLFAVMASSGGTGKASLLALLAALSPVIRAGFDWAQLLYFDSVRLEVPQLRGLRSRFDAAVLRLAAVMGAATWVVAAGVGSSLLGVWDAALLVALLPFFVMRSLLAAAQVRAFTASAYRRLCIVGALGGLASFVAIAAVPSITGRLALLTIVLAASLLALVALPAPIDVEDRVLALPDWLAHLRKFPGPVSVTRVAFDVRSQARGVTEEKRRTEEWRRRLVARSIGSQLARRCGAVAWLGPYDLACFGPDNDVDWITRMGGGLVRRQPMVSHFPTGSAAARHMLCSILGQADLIKARDVETLVAEFENALPGGIVFRIDRPVPAELAAMSSHERAEILGAALRFARDPIAASGRRRWDVTALSVDGRLRVIFVANGRHRVEARRRWTERVRAVDLTIAALGRGPSNAAPVTMRARAER